MVTASTDIYTLSLHDALPIYLGQVVTVVRFLEHVDRDEGVVGDERRLEDRRGACVERLSRRGDARGAGVVRQVDQDRKSTRLNSSHQIISYAVFCLKKKKT